MGVVLIVGTQKGALVARADEARDRWEIGPMQFQGWIVNAATRDSGGRYYIGASHEIYGTVVMVSDDLEDWRQIEKGPKYADDTPGNAVHNRVIGAGDPATDGDNPLRHLDRIWRFLPTPSGVYAGVSEAGLFHSDDRGESWQPIAGLNDHPTRSEWQPGAGGLCAHSLLTDPADPSRIWLGISAVGVFRSDDGGATWSAKNDGVSEGYGFCVHGLAQDPHDANLIFRQDHRGMYRTRDGGDQWEVIENGLPIGTVQGDHRAVFGFPIEIDPHTRHVYCVPLEGDEFHVPHDGRLRVYRTGNQGDTWEPLDQGLPETPTYTSVLRGAMSIDGLSPGGVYFGTSSGGVYASADGGDSWMQLPVNLPRVLCVEAFAE